MYSRRSLSEGRNLFSRLIHLTRAFPNLRLLSFIITWEASCINVCKRTINSDLLCLIGLCSWLNSYRGNFWGNPTKLNFSSQQLSTEKKHPFVLSPFLSQGCEILCQCSPVALSKVHKNREWKNRVAFLVFFMLVSALEGIHWCECGTCGSLSPVAALKQVNEDTIYMECYREVSRGAGFCALQW